MTEQFALDQGLRNGGAIHRHKGMIRSRTMEVNGPGDELLPGSILPSDQDPTVRRTGCFDEIPQSPHRRRLPDQFKFPLDLAPQRPILLG